MARRAAKELAAVTETVTAANDTKSSGGSGGVAAISAVKSENNGRLATEIGKQQLARDTAKASRVVAAVTFRGGNETSLAPRHQENPEGLEVLQLMAKGQALSSAVVVVEGVLHKMEEQARKRTAFPGQGWLLAGCCT